MLASLTVQNFAIIDNINIDFHNGLTVLTGETGAGKSLIIDAIGLLFGNRASANMIRTGASKAIVEGVFVDCGKKVMDIISENGLDTLDDGMVVVKREINENGKSLIRVNGMVVTLHQLNEIAYYLADIHTQLDTKKLFDVDNYVDFIDDLESLNIQKEYLEKLKKFKNARLTYLEKIRRIQEDADNLDYLKYQLNELENANLLKNELEDIEKELDELNNYEHIYQNLVDIKSSFQTNNIVGELYNIKQNLAKIKDLSDSYNKTYETLENLYYELEAVEEDLVLKANSLEFDEKRFDKLNERFTYIKELMRKHRMSYDELLKYRDNLKERVNTSLNNEVFLEDLKQEVINYYEELKEVTTKLTNKRKNNALKIKEDILNTLRTLYLEKVVLDIKFNDYKYVDPFKDDFYLSNGADIVNFHISFNVGEPLKELSKVASGGEMSRVMLAFKVHLLNNLELSTMIFDEIDTGVSGIVARAMADKLRVISKNTQVLSITHLPIVAAAANHHLYISKKFENDRTFTVIKELSYDERIEELAKMISSNKDDITSQRLAEDMINLYK